MSEPADKAASDLTTRFAAAVVMVAVAFVAIYLGGWGFRALVALAAGVMMFEWGAMHRAPRWSTYVGIALLAVPTLVLPELYFPAAQGSPTPLSPDLLMPAWLCFGIVAGIAIVYGVFSRRLSQGW